MDSAILRETPGSAGPRAKPESQPAHEQAQDTEKRAAVVCLACGALVASIADKTRIEGRHDHRFMNPDGLTFEIACFSRAPGTMSIGESSSVWTWFPGYVWQAVACRSCVRHLGWSYRRGADGFFGLISDRIAELPAQRSD